MSALVDQIIARARARLPAGVSPAYFDAFLAAHRADLQGLIEQAAGARIEPELWSAADRTRANLRAMRVAASTQPANMTASDRLTLAAYSGWGGLSIEAAAPHFPAGFPIPEERGLIHEYYTPTKVCAAVAAAVRPLLPALAQGGAVLALEPSAGIGRFVRAFTGPGFEAVRWTAVEYSELSSRLLRTIRADLHVVTSSFEAWVAGPRADLAGLVQLVVCNPPYGVRDESVTQDPVRFYRELGGKKKAYVYFLRRGLDLLAPNGIGVYLIPYGFLTGKSAAYQDLRAAVLRRHHLSAAFRLPSRLFPGAMLVTDLLFFRARGGELAEVDPADQFIVAGDYFMRFPHHVLGREVGRKADEDDATAKPRWGYQVEGTFTTLPPLVERPFCASCVPRPFQPRAVKRPAPAVLSDEDTPEARMIASAQALGPRVATYLSQVARQLPEAAASWGELTRALQAHVTVHGSPRAGAALLRAARSQPDVARFLSAFEADGQLIPGLRDKPQHTQAFTGGVEDVVAQAEWMFRQLHQVRLDTLQQWHARLGGKLTEVQIPGLLRAARWALDGDLWYPPEVYYTGDLWPRYDRAKALGDAGDAGQQEQAVRLLEAMKIAVWEDITFYEPPSDNPLPDSGLSPASGWVPQDVLEAWLTTKNRVEKYRETVPVKLEWSAGVLTLAGVPYDELQAREFSGAKSLRWDARRKAETQMAEGRLVVDEVRHIIGWINHDNALFKPPYTKSSTKERKLARRRGVEVEGEDADKTKDDRHEQDRARVEAARQWRLQFTAWCQERKLEPRLAEAYNRRFRGFVARTEYPDGPLNLTRWTKGDRQPRFHQNRAARRLLAQRGGLCAFGVGVGKCVRGDTPVFTSAGILPIRDIFQAGAGNVAVPAPGQAQSVPCTLVRVASLADDGTMVWRSARELYRQHLTDDERTLRVGLRKRGEEEVTGAHPYLVLRAGMPTWTRARDLCVGDYVAAPAYLPEPPTWPSCDPDLAELVTWQLTEGHEAGQNISVITQEDTGTLARLRAVFLRLFPGVHRRVDIRPGRRLWNRTPDLYINSGEYRRALDTLRFPWGTRSAARVFPPQFLSLPRETLRRVVRTFMDAEGSVTAEGVIELSSASRMLLVQLRYMLLRFGIHGRLSSKVVAIRRGPTAYWRLVLTGRDAHAFAAEIGATVSYKADALDTLGAKACNPNIDGIPVGDVLAALRAAGIPVVYVYGCNPQRSLRIVSAEKAADMLRQLRQLSTPAGVAALQQRVDAISTPFAAVRLRRTLQHVLDGQDVLRQCADQLEARLALDVRWDEVQTLLPGEAGGLVYDLVVDVPADGAELPFAANYVAGSGAVLLHNTLTGILTIAAARQEGWVQRPVVVVPPSVAWNWDKELRAALPDYRILVIGSERYTVRAGPRAGLLTSRTDTPQARAAKWTRFQAGEADVALVTYPAFMRSQLHLETAMAHAQARVGIQRELRIRERNIRKRLKREIAAFKERYGHEPDTAELAALAEEINRRMAEAAGLNPDDDGDLADDDSADEDSADDEAPVKKKKGKKSKKKPRQIVSERDLAILRSGLRAWVAERMELPEGQLPDPGIFWEDLGVDLLIVDEAQNFKNLYLPEPRDGGSPPKYMGGAGEGSQRAWQLDFRAAAVRARTGGAGIVLLSATPAKNSPLELYNLIQYIDPEVWEAVGIAGPEQFIEYFLEIQRRVAPKIDLTMEEQACVIRFLKNDDARNVIFRYGEFRSDTDIEKEAKDRGIPGLLSVPQPVVERHMITLSADQNALYDEYHAQLKDLKDDPRSGGNALGILARMNLVTVHPALAETITWRDAVAGDADPHAPKLDAVAQLVAKDHTCGHIIFVQAMAAHWWMRQCLIEAGVAPERIVILNGETAKATAERERISAEFNGNPDEGIEPRYDVVIANSIAYEGVNLQTRTCAIHHLDLPWEPATLEQRNGRGVRQGNTLASVVLHYYFALGSSDALMFAMIDGKAGWMKSLIASTDRITANPAVEGQFDGNQLAMLLIRDPDELAAALAELKQQDFAARVLSARRRALLNVTDAFRRFAAARREADPQRALVARTDAERLIDLALSTPPELYPWVRHLGHARDGQIIAVGRDLWPLWPGARVRDEALAQLAAAGNPEGTTRATAPYPFVEVGTPWLQTVRDSRRWGGGVATAMVVPCRAAGLPFWRPIFASDLLGMSSDPPAPDDFDPADWPVADATEAQAVLRQYNVERSGGLRGAWNRGWRFAPAGWTEVVWPVIAERIAREGGDLGYTAATSEPLPLLDASEDRVRWFEARSYARVPHNHTILPPTAAGWDTFVDYVRQRKLHKDKDNKRISWARWAYLADYWWGKPLPRGLWVKDETGDNAHEDAVADDVIE